MEKSYNCFKKRLKKANLVFGVIMTSLFVLSCERKGVEEVAPLEAIQDVQEHGAIIPGKYIVVYNDDVDFNVDKSAPYDIRQNKMRQHGISILKGKGIPAARLGHVYSSAIKGMAVELSSYELKHLQKDSRVAYIEKDRIIKLAPPAGRKPNKNNGNTSPQETPWGIGRVGGGVKVTGKTAWVIDTGIDLDHADLNVDVARSRTMFTFGRDAASADDGHGHGTHVAGTIAALDNSVGVIGVAAGATVVAVKVLDSNGSGSYSGVIAGVDYVAAAGATGDVANMSLGGPASQALDDAVKAAAKNIKFALAAGNDGSSAMNTSPARAGNNNANIYTTSAIDSNDNFAYFSNYGNPPIRFAAPGVSVNSTWKDGGYNTISGTSMASPHVAGLLLLGEVKADGTAKGDPDGNPDSIAHR